MSLAFTISLPAEPRFRDLASGVAGKYVELVGGSAADAEALASSVIGGIEDLAGEDGPTSDVRLVFESTPAGVDVTLHCHGRSAVVSHPLPARKS
jgi:hypothetical protein